MPSVTLSNLQVDEDPHNNVWGKNPAFNKIFLKN